MRAMKMHRKREIGEGDRETEREKERGIEKLIDSELHVSWLKMSKQIAQF